MLEFSVFYIMPSSFITHDGNFNKIQWQFQNILIAMTLYFTLDHNKNLTVLLFLKEVIQVYIIEII